MTDTREHILREAFGLFLQKNFKEVTMSELLERTGLSKGGFYHHFKSKEALFEAVIAHYLQAFNHHQHSDPDSLTLRQYIRECARRSGELTRLIREESGISDTEKANANFYFLIFDALKMLPGFRKNMQQQQLNELNAWSRVIRNARKRGEIKSSLSDKQIASIFIHTGDGTSLNLVLGGNPENLGQDILALWMKFYETLQV